MTTKGQKMFYYISEISGKSISKGYKSIKNLYKHGNIWASGQNDIVGVYDISKGFINGFISAFEVFNGGNTCYFINIDKTAMDRKVNELRGAK